jgi:hypothetical protein
LKTPPAPSTSSLIEGLSPIFNLLRDRIPPKSHRILGHNPDGTGKLCAITTIALSPPAAWDTLPTPVDRRPKLQPLHHLDKRESDGRAAYRYTSRRMTSGACVRHHHGTKAPCRRTSTRSSPRFTTNPPFNPAIQRCSSPAHRPAGGCIAPTRQPARGRREGHHASASCRTRGPGRRPPHPHQGVLCASSSLTLTAWSLPRLQCSRHAKTLLTFSRDVHG